MSPLGFGMFDDDDDDDFFSYKTRKKININRKSAQQKRQARAIANPKPKPKDNLDKIMEMARTNNEELKNLARQVIDASDASEGRYLGTQGDQTKRAKFEAIKPKPEPKIDRTTIRVEEEPTPSQKEKLIRILESTLKMTDVFFDISKEERQQLLAELKGEQDEQKPTGRARFSEVNHY